MLSIAKLTRSFKSLANAMSFFFPIYIVHSDLQLALKYSIPIFFIVATGFIINDINDVEKDTINGKLNVLPQKEMSIQWALVLYYSFLSISLISIKLFIPGYKLFYYLVYLVLATNYDYIVRFKPSLKNLYVLCLALTHVAILYILTSVSVLLLTCLVINVLSKEIFMDIRDLKGDGITFVKLYGVNVTNQLLYFLQIALHSLASIFVYLNNDTSHVIILLLLFLLALIGFGIWRYSKCQSEIQMIRILIVQSLLIFGLILL